MKTVLTCAATAWLLQSCGSGGGDGDQITGFSYVPELNAVYQPYVPEQGAAVPVAARAALESADLPYPPFNTHDIKSIGPAGWQNRAQIVDAGAGGVIFNMLWSIWQPSGNLSLRDPNTFEYDNMVWRIDPVTEKQIRWYSSRGIKVTAVLYSTPEWARTSNTAKVADVPLIHPKFIAPDNPDDFARFAGMIAKRYNGANGNGRIVNFIIQNEINAIDWYNPGCGAPGHPCVIDDRINSYATVFNKAYDRVISEQSQANVFFSFDHHFGAEYYDAPRFSSVQRFIEALDPLVSPREWRVAFHSYPSDLFNPVFGPYDYPKVTFGNLGVLAGYLRQRFPNKPHAWDIHLTENGLNAADPSSQSLQSSQLPIAVRNILGTPGVNNFVYHRLRDHFQEGSFQPGLHDSEANPREAWYIWSNNNRYRQSPPVLAHGYEDLPYVRLVRSVHPDHGHWASTRQAPEGYTAEQDYLLLREELPNTTLLYECYNGWLNVTRISRSVSCGGEQNFGPVGYAFQFNDQTQSRRELFSIAVAGDYVLTTNPNEISGVVSSLGFVDASKVLQQPIPQRDLSYFDTEYASNTQPVEIANQAAAEQVISSLGACDDGTDSCHFLRFSVTSGQTNFLSCDSQQQTGPRADILLNYGNDLSSRAVDIEHTVNGSGNRYTIPLPIPDDATRASIVISSDQQAMTSHCVVIQRGGLTIGAAEDLEKNRLQNGGFEDVRTDWELCADDGSADFTDNYYTGSRAMEVSNGNCVYQEISVDVGEKYSLSCRARHLGPGAGSLKFTFSNDSFQQLKETELPVNSIGYEEYSVVDVAPAGSVYAVVTFSSGVGSGLLDACSVVPVE